MNEIKIEYPKLIRQEQLEQSFKLAVLHSVCWAGNDYAKRKENHAFGIGFYIGRMEAIYLMRWRKNPESITTLVIDETHRIKKLLGDYDTEE